MTLSEKELLIEQEYLQKTLEIVKKIISEKDINISSNVSGVNDFKQYLWSNMSDMDDIEIASNREMINSQVYNTNENIKQLIQLKKSLLSPYFGRVDFYIDNEDNTMVYVGINGVSEGLDFYVFDWRSPIGSLFYNYGIGSASYTALAGEISGEIKLKRQYKIENGFLIRCFNSDINIDDEYLQEILASSSTDKMKNIVNTIQQEQNVIIRNINDKLLIVQGIAGSGKTSVALHRIAFLLYREKNLTSNNILIFSPNSVFSEYISNVLPELGEENVMQSTFSFFAESYTKEFKKIESFTDFVERFYKNNNDDGINNLIKFKLSDEIKPQIDNFLNEYKKMILFNSGISIDEKTMTKEELNNLIQVRFAKFGIDEKIENLVDYICTSFNISEKKYAKQIESKLLEKICVPLDLKVIYSMFIENIAEKKDIDMVKSNKNQLKYEDLIPYLYMKFELFGYPKNHGIRHIVIDEAQDYTNLQFNILSKIFKNSSFTILGDINQTINPYYKHDNLDKVSNYFSIGSRYVELNKTYRSSEEIIEYSNDILGLNNNSSVRHNNSIPVIIKDVDEENLLFNIKTDIENMKSNGVKRLAIITKNDNESLYIFEKLKEDISNLSIITNHGKTILSDVIVLPSYLAKGLEFDGVIAYANPQNLYSDKDRYLYYVVCTRAQHQLIVYNQKLEKQLRK